MVSVKNEINDILLNTVSDLENRMDEARTILADIQAKMDSKVSEAKEYKVSVDDAKEKIKVLEEEIKALENDLSELKEKYGKKNLVAVIEAGTKEINLEIKKKQDEIQIHKNKIAELTNRARSIKDLLLNLKKDKKIKEEKLEELENCTKYYKLRLEEVVKFAEEHDDLNDYLNQEVTVESNDSVNVFEDIVGINDEEENDGSDENNSFDEVSIAEADEVFNDVINPNDDEDNENDIVELDEESDKELSFDLEENKEVEELKEESLAFNDEEDNLEKFDYEDKHEEIKEEALDEGRDLEISDLLSSVKEPIDLTKEKVAEIDNNKISNINKAIDEEFANIFGKNINEPVNTMDIFGNEFSESLITEEDIVNNLTTLGLDYYSFTEEDRKIINNNFNEQTIGEIISVLKTNKIQLDNVYVAANILSSIAPAELSNIISKLLNVGQSAEAIGYILDKLPLVDAKLLDITINNYGEYIKNVDIVDIIVKSMKGDN